MDNRGFSPEEGSRGKRIQELPLEDMHQDKVRGLGYTIVRIASYALGAIVCYDCEEIWIEFDPHSKDTNYVRQI